MPLTRAARFAVVASQRAQALAEWLRALLRGPGAGSALAHPAFLEFIGFPGPPVSQPIRAADYESPPACTDGAAVPTARATLSVSFPHPPERTPTSTPSSPTGLAAKTDVTETIDDVSADTVGARAGTAVQEGRRLPASAPTGEAGVDAAHTYPVAASLSPGSAAGGALGATATAALDPAATVSSWLEGLRSGYGPRFAHAFEEVGVEAAGDLPYVNEAIMAPIERALVGGGAKMLRERRRSRRSSYP